MARRTAERVRAPRAPGETAQRILDVAEALVQTRGFNDVSYGDVAEQLGITTASVHYHFPGKAELGQALISRYAERFAGSLAAIDDEQSDAPAQLDAYARLYAEVLRAERMCLCGMLAAEYQTLPSEVQEEIIVFFDDNEAWLARVLQRGRRNGTLRFEGSARETARVLIDGLEGAMLLARSYGARDRFRATAARLLASVAADG